jgi:hypothetical protein
VTLFAEKNAIILHLVLTIIFFSGSVVGTLLNF